MMGSERWGAAKWLRVTFAGSKTNYKKNTMRLILIIIILLLPLYVQAEPLNLDAAIQLALRNDPLLAKLAANRASFADLAESASTLPDPKIKLGVVNFPSTEFNFEKLDMTQGVVGVMQTLPAWGSLDAKSAKLLSTSDMLEGQRNERQLRVIRNVRKKWLAVYLWAQSKRLVETSVDVFSQLKKITRLQYRTGQGKQQDVIRSQLEESLLLDKVSEMQERFEAAVADLKAELNVSSLEGEMDSQFPTFPDLPEEDRLVRELDKHPLAQVEQARIKVAESGVEFAEAQFRPGVSLDVTYGYRSANRSDLISAMVIMDLPLFTGQKQNKQLSASQSELSAAKFGLEDVKRSLRGKLDDNLAKFRRSNDRITLYETQLLPQAEQNTEASLNAYQSGVNSFNVLVRSRLTELNSRLQHLALKVRKANAQVELLYLFGAKSS